MKRLLYIFCAFALIVSMLDARPSSGGHSSGGSRSSGSRSYGSSRSFSAPSRSYSAPSARPQSKASYGASSTFDSSSKANWGSSKAVPITRSNAETSVNRTVNQNGGTINRSQATRDQSAAQTSRTYQAPAGYNSRTSYSTARGYRHYYDYQPSYWPYDLPMRYMYMGMMYNLMWSPLYHSYGWYGPGQSWVYYDSVANGQMVNQQVDQAQIDQSGQPRTMVVQRDNGGAFILFAVVLFLVIVAILVIVWWRSRANTDSAITISGNTVEGASLSYLPPPEPKKTFLSRGLNSLRQGQIITLTDPISMKDARALNPKSKGLKVTVDQILVAREKDDACAWTFIYGTSEFESQAVLIKIKDVDGSRACVCYTRDVEGTRQDLLNGGAHFLFARPESDDINPSELDYSQSFARNLSGEGDETFGAIHGELHGSAYYLKPGSSLRKTLLATVAEWRNAARPENEYLALETGTKDGSHVEGWWGDALAVADLRFPS